MDNSKIIKIGSRASPLAVKQVDEILDFLANQDIPLQFERCTYQSNGDKDKKTSLTNVNVPDNFFTDTVDAALLNKKIDIAIHSAKDLPQRMQEGFAIFALTESPDETDAFVGKVPFNQLPKGAKVGTSSLVRQQSVKALNANVDIVDIRGTIDERIKLVEAGHCDGAIVATVALKRLGLEQHITDIMPWEATPLQGQLAIVGRVEDTELAELFSKVDVRRTYGKVFLVGAGPGDPELLTLKAKKLLEQVDCVLYDYLAPHAVLEYASMAEKINVGKRKGAHSMPQAELSKLIREKAMAGKMVARLKGGDPLIFGRGAEEIEYLRAYHIDVQVIPGVSSATAIPSSLGIPLTARSIASSVAFVSGYKEGEDHTQPQAVEIPDVDTIVFLMGLTKLDIIIKSLKDAGWKEDTPIMLISKGTCADEKVIKGNLVDIQEKVKQQKFDPPVLIVVGKIVNF